MKKNGKKLLILGIALLVMFVIWTCLIQCVDVKSAGKKGTEIGFATFNCWFHRITGVHMAIYTITDWLGLVGGDITAEYKDGQLYIQIAF